LHRPSSLSLSNKPTTPIVIPSLSQSSSQTRRDLILAAASPDELLEVMEDLARLRVVPLLQALLSDA
jgi:hypothetical protein